MKYIIPTIALVIFSICGQAKADTIYNCTGIAGSSPDVRGKQAKLTVINKDVVKIADIENDGPDGGGLADRDMKYNPRLNDEFQRFERRDSVEGTEEVLVSDKIMDGAANGKVKLQWRGEGFSSDTYNCHKQ